MREIELKSVVPDERACIDRLERGGARRVFDGKLRDSRFDTRERALTRRDLVLRLRVETDAGNATQRATLDWKEPTEFERGFKLREETRIGISDADAMQRVLERLGLEVSREIERDVTVFDAAGATVRFERFPRMDVLVEVEGEPQAIESAIDLLGLPRAGFVPDRLAAFITRYEARTGERAAVSAREARGEYRYPIDDA